jgi:transposase
VTAAVKAQMQREKDYWVTQIPKLEVAEEKLRMQLGRARARGAAGVEKLEEGHEAARRQLARAECFAEINVPSAIYDPIVYFTSGKYAEYRKDAFRGERSNPTFREGQPVRWRDKSWEIARDPERKGSYEVTLPVHTSDSKVERASFKLVPDGPSMYGWAKRMTDPDELAAGSAKQCDARFVYSEKKKQWFAKLTARFTYEVRKPGSQVAAMRRGQNNAFVIAFEDGTCKMITGDDVIAFKAKIKARKESIWRHLRSLERGSGSYGRGKKRAFAAVTRVDGSEARFVDTRCKTWAAAIVKVLRFRGVGKLIVASSDAKEFIDSLDNEVLQARLRQWPFAKALDCLKRACEYAGIEVEERSVGFNARRCPQCGYTHEKRQDGTFTCESCRPEFKRPSDQIIAWNMLKDVVGDEPIRKSEKLRRVADGALRGEATT